MSVVELGMPSLPTAPRGVGHLRGDKPFPDAAREALRDGQLRANLGHATTTIRAKRARVAAELLLAEVAGTEPATGRQVVFEPELVVRSSTRGSDR